MQIKTAISSLTATVGSIPSATPTYFGQTIGIDGAIGVQGFQGNQGNLGLQGVLGLIGVDGIQGNQGNPGNQGLQGVLGVIGVEGFQGNQGNRGIQGTDGFIGPLGFAGGQGAQGNLGNQGIQGLGIQGFQGVSSGGGLTVGTMISYVPYFTGQTSPTTNVFDLGPTGNYDLLTVPVGKKLYVISYSISNTSGVTIQHNLGFRGVGGTFIRIFPTTNSNSGNNGSFASPVIFDSGEIVGVFVSGSGGTCRITSFLFDSSPNILSIKKINGWTAGDNTIYTCPVGKSAIALYSTPYQLPPSGGAVQYFNGSTANATLNIYAVPNGQTVQAKYSISFFTAPQVRAPGNTLQSFTFSLFSGDSIVINTTSNLDAQVAIVSLYEY